MNPTNSWIPINHSIMNWGQFKDPVCYLCLVNCVVTSLSLTQDVAGSNNILHKKLSLTPVNSVKTLRENLIV